MNLNEASMKAVEIARKRGFKDDTEQALKHCATEVVESMGAYINWTHGNGEQELEKLKEEFAGELADVIMCVFSICGIERINIDIAVKKCFKKNAERAESIKVKAESRKTKVEACKICDNNCGYCKYNCNCSTEVEI